MPAVRNDRTQCRENPQTPTDVLRCGASRRGVTVGCIPLFQAWRQCLQEDARAGHEIGQRARLYPQCHRPRPDYAAFQHGCGDYLQPEFLPRGALGTQQPFHRKGRARAAFHSGLRERCIPGPRPGLAVPGGRRDSGGSPRAGPNRTVRRTPDSPRILQPLLSGRAGQLCLL